MIESEKKKFTAAVVGLAGFYGAELSHMALGIYWDTLREHELEALQEAMWCHVKDPEPWALDAKAGRHHPPPARPIGSWALTQPGRSPCIARAVGRGRNLRGFHGGVQGVPVQPFGKWAIRSAQGWPSRKPGRRRLQEYGGQVEVSMGHHKAGRAACCSRRCSNRP